MGAAGYIVDAISSVPKEGAAQFLASSKFVHEFKEVISKKVGTEYDEELRDALLAYKGTTEEKPVLIPTDGYTTSIMDLNREIYTWKSF